nr:2-keto-4-pentenoate hydratase [Thermicanus aegyptius]
MGQEKWAELVDILEAAEKGRKAIRRLTLTHPFDIEEAYAIQEAWISRKIRDGERLIGYKMGLTSPAKMKQMKVSEPIYGKLLAGMYVDSGEALPHSQFIHPRVEAEVAFLLGKDLKGEGLTEEEVFSATDHLMAAIEIIDSRYENFQFTMADVIADNASSSRFAVGTLLLTTGMDKVSTLGMTLRINGEVKALGTPANILGHPARSVAMLAGMLARKGEGLKAGEIILAGGITEAVAVQPGDVVEAHFARLGNVSVRFV